ncbi:MAG: hypothetical protein J0M24_18185 [Verrucomicrobia bacterium]|nr:hypothetical protein [Verrucomicrobiota bacterium]
MTSILDTLCYPLRGNGGILILTGAILLAALSLFLGIPRLGFLIELFIFGYFGAHFIEVINSTVQGRDEPPDWPAVTDIAEDIVDPLVRLLGLLLISFGPLAMVRYFGAEMGGGYRAGMIGAGLWAAIYFPMSLIAVTVTDQLAAASPHIVLPAIGRSLPGYLLNVVYLVGVWVGLTGIQWTASQIPYLGLLLAKLTWLYGLILLSRGIGLIYRQQRDRLEWE